MNVFQAKSAESIFCVCVYVCVKKACHMTGPMHSAPYYISVFDNGGVQVYKTGRVRVHVRVQAHAARELIRMYFLPFPPPPRSPSHMTARSGSYRGLTNVVV